MVNFPGGFPGRFPGNSPFFPPNFPMQPNRPGGQPTPGRQSGPGAPPPHIINQFNSLQQNPTNAPAMLRRQNDFQTFAVGCEGRWTIVQLWNGQLFLMFVLSTNIFGQTTGIIWPNFTFASFPSSQIAFYQCF